MIGRSPTPAERAGLSPGDPVTAGVRVLRPDPGAGLEPVPHGEGVGRADAAARLRPLRHRGQRRRVAHRAGAGPDRPRSRGRRARHADLLLPVGRSRGVREDHPGGPGGAQGPRVVPRHQDGVQHPPLAAAADPLVRHHRLPRRPARLARPAHGRGSRPRFRPDQRHALLADRHRHVGHPLLLRGRQGRGAGRAEHGADRAGDVQGRLRVDAHLRRARPQGHPVVARLRGARRPLRGAPGAGPARPGPSRLLPGL